MQFNPLRKGKKWLLDVKAKRRFERGESSSSKQPNAIAERAENYFETDMHSFHHGLLDDRRRNMSYTSNINDPLTKLFQSIRQDRDANITVFYIQLNAHNFQPFEEAIEKDDMSQVYSVDLESLKAWTRQFHIECEYLFHDKAGFFLNENGHHGFVDLARRIEEESNQSTAAALPEAGSTSAQTKWVNQKTPQPSATVIAILSVLKRQTLNLPPSIPENMEARCENALNRLQTIAVKHKKLEETIDINKLVSWVNDPDNDAKASRIFSQHELYRIRQGENALTQLRTAIGQKEVAEPIDIDKVITSINDPESAEKDSRIFSKDELDSIHRVSEDTITLVAEKIRGKNAFNRLIDQTAQDRTIAEQLISTLQKIHISESRDEDIQHMFAAAPAALYVTLRSRKKKIYSMPSSLFATQPLNLKL